jgi:hypothetical protein
MSEMSVFLHKQTIRGAAAVGKGLFKSALSYRAFAQAL